MATDAPGPESLSCFLDHARPCGADCMAFNVVPTQKAGALVVLQDQCTLLAVGKGLLNTARRLDLAVEKIVSRFP